MYSIPIFSQWPTPLIYLKSLGSTDQIYDSVDRIIESFNFHPSIKNNRRNYKITSKFSFKPVSKEFVKGIGQKKNLVLGNAGDEKYLHPGVNLFFNRFSGDILFSCLVSFAFLYSRFCCCLFVCFLKLKVYILIHIRLCVRVSDIEIFTQLFLPL